MGCALVSRPNSATRAVSLVIRGEEVRRQANEGERMPMPRGFPPGNEPAQVVIDTASNSGGRVTAAASALALLLSGWSVWETSLKQPDLKVFVPPVIHYASPLQNSNFELLAIPVTLINEGARTGTVLSLELTVTDPEKKLSKRFFSADVGRYSVAAFRAGDFRSFSPIALPGRASHTETVLFHPRREEKVMQLIAATGRYRFELKLNAALSDDFGWLDRRWRKEAPSVSFEMVLPFLDHRAFTQGAGTIPMYQKDWQTTSGGG
jgi:hypothetical protein